MAITSFPKISKYALKRQISSLRDSVAVDLCTTPEKLDRAYENFLYEMSQRGQCHVRSRLEELTAQIVWLENYRKVQLYSIDFEDNKALRKKWLTA